MLTQCPSCQTMFRVTHEILRVADGQVRCGRCQTQFDALERLVQEEPAEEIATDDTDLPVEDFEVEEPEDHEEITLEGRHIEITGTYRVAGEDAADAGLRQEVTEEWVEIEDIDAAETSTEEAVEDIAEEFAQDAAQDVAEELDDLSAEFEQTDPQADEQAEDAVAIDRPFEPLAPAPAAPIAAFRRRRVSEDEDEHVDLLPAPAARQARPLIWTLLALPLVLLLAIQIVHHYRGDLARHPRVGELLMRAYGALDLPLTPEWDLHAYEIRQWGVMADQASPGTLRVRANITNRAEFPQPYPLLKLILEDRWGDQVRARAFEPSEYLDPAVSPDRLLAPAQQANATIVIVDPGPDAEGFRFDVCLRGAAGPVCAAEILTR